MPKSTMSMVKLRKIVREELLKVIVEANIPKSGTKESSKRK